MVVVVPSVRCTEATQSSTLPFCWVWLPSWCRPMLCTPTSASDLSSPLSVTPSVSASTHTFRSAKAASWALIWPSALASYCARACQPSRARLPSARRVLVPSSSAPVLMRPSWFRSMTSKPSWRSTQPTLCAVPVFIKSNCTPCPMPSVCTPSPFKSSTSGEADTVTLASGMAAEISTCAPVVLWV